MNVNPYVEPTVPLLSVNVAPLIAWCTVWVVLAVAYAAACWARFRGLPGQRLLSLQVADAATGKNLSLPRATWRAVLVSGIPAAATAVLLVAMCELLATVIPADIAGAGGTSYINATYNDTGGDFVSLCSLASWAWPLLLLISTAASRDRRGLHDRLARSVVVGRAKAFGAWGTAYAQVPYGPPASHTARPASHTAQARRPAPDPVTLPGRSIRTARSRARPICRRRTSRPAASYRRWASRPRRSAVASRRRGRRRPTATTGRSSARSCRPVCAWRASTVA